MRRKLAGKAVWLTYIPNGAAAKSNLQSNELFRDNFLDRLGKGAGRLGTRSQTLDKAKSFEDRAKAVASELPSSSMKTIFGHRFEQLRAAGETRDIGRLARRQCLLDGLSVGTRTMRDGTRPTP